MLAPLARIRLPSVSNQVMPFRIEGVWASVMNGAKDNRRIEISSAFFIGVILAFKLKMGVENTFN